MFESIDDRTKNGSSGWVGSKQRWRFVVGAALLALSIFIPISLIVVLINAADSSSYLFLGLFHIADDTSDFLIGVAVVVYFGLSYLSGHIFKTWKECQEPTADEAMALDTRPPILYLRPFKLDKLALTTLDRRTAATKRGYASMFGFFGVFLGLFLWGLGYGRKKRAEEMIVDLLSPLGPVIAIGRPGERVPQIGAARLYVGDDWQDVIRSFMSRSQLIVMFGGTTPGFAWEVAEAFRNAPFVPTILLLPYFHKHNDEEVKRFVEIFTSGSGLTMPTDLRKIRAAYFPSPQETITVPDLDTKAEQELHQQNPFLSALGRILHRNDPDWVENTASSAKEENRTMKRKLRWLTIIPLILLLLRLAVLVGSCN